MGSLDKRFGNLERLLEPPQDEGAESRRPIVREILDAFARLKASRAVHYRGGVRIEPEDIPGNILGTGYTSEQMWELAAKRASEREDRRGA